MFLFLKMYIKSKLRKADRGVLFLTLFFLLSICSINAIVTILTNLILTSEKSYYSNTDVRTVFVENLSDARRDSQCLAELDALPSVEKVTESEIPNNFYIIVDKQENIDELITFFEQNQYRAFQNANVKEEIESVRLLIKTVKAMCAVILLSIFMILFLFILKKVKERNQEIALYKSFGYQYIMVSGIIFLDFMIPFLLASFFGVFLSALFDKAVIPYIIENATIQMNPLQYLGIAGGMISLIAIALLMQIPRLKKIPLSVLFVE